RSNRQAVTDLRPARLRKARLRKAERPREPRRLRERRVSSLADRARSAIPPTRRAPSSAPRVRRPSADRLSPHHDAQVLDREDLGVFAWADRPTTWHSTV